MSNMQLVLENDCISVHAAIFEDVLVSKSFQGADCYRQLLEFIRAQYGSDVISATIVVK